MQLARNERWSIWRRGRIDRADGIFLQNLPTLLDCRKQPADTRIGNENGGTDKLRQTLAHRAFGSGFLVHVDIDRNARLLAGEFPVQIVRLEDWGAANDETGWKLVDERFIPRGIFRVFRHKHDGSPAELAEIFQEFQDALHPRPARRRKVVRNDKNVFFFLAQ